MTMTLHIYRFEMNRSSAVVAGPDEGTGERTNEDNSFVPPFSFGVGRGTGIGRYWGWVEGGRWGVYSVTNALSAFSFHVQTKSTITVFY